MRSSREGGGEALAGPRRPRGPRHPGDEAEGGLTCGVRLAPGCLPWGEGLGGWELLGQRDELRGFCHKSGEAAGEGVMGVEGRWPGEDGVASPVAPSPRAASSVTDTPKCTPGGGTGGWSAEPAAQAGRAALGRLLGQYSRGFSGPWSPTLPWPWLVWWPGVASLQRPPPLVHQ